MTTNSSPPIELFLCYAHEDEELRLSLERQLRALKRQGWIDVWHDRQIPPGGEWEGEVDKHLNSAQIILLLISPDFMDSDYCYGIEMRRALERHDSRKARVIPIILRPTLWQGTPFSKLQALPTGACFLQGGHSSHLGEVQHDQKSSEAMRCSQHSSRRGGSVFQVSPSHPLRCQQSPN